MSGSVALPSAKNQYCCTHSKSRTLQCYWMEAHKISNRCRGTIAAVNEPIDVVIVQFIVKHQRKDLGMQFLLFVRKINWLPHQSPLSDHKMNVRLIIPTTCLSILKIW